MVMLVWKSYSFVECHFVGGVHFWAEYDAYSTHDVSEFVCFCAVALQYDSIAVDVEVVFSESPRFLYYADCSPIVLFHLVY